MQAADTFWDPPAWNPIGGCSHASAGCENCFAQGLIPLQKSRRTSIYFNVTEWFRGRHRFNGHLTARPPGHRDWLFPLKWKGADNPLLGVGKPSILFVADMCDLFEENRPKSIIDKVVATVAASDHIGLILTKRTQRMSEYFLADRRPIVVKALESCRLWLGFSAEDQRCFDKRWPPMKKLAAEGWFTFVSIAPMLGPVRLPDDFLALGKRTWCLCYGEQGPNWRPMDPDWTRAVRDQCREAGIPFFMKQMAGKQSIPPDLLVRQFPEWPPQAATKKLVVNVRGTNGSGKSTVVRTLIRRYGATPLYGALGRSNPEAYQFKIPTVADPVFVIGPYEGTTPGCDRIENTDVLLDLIKKYQQIGHVIFEGMVVSTYYGKVGSSLERWRDRSLIVFLDTPVEVCIERVEARRSVSRHRTTKPFETGLRQKFATIAGLKEKMIAAGIRTITVSSTDAPSAIVRELSSRSA
ncbi:MAG TPA: DUF5131 family protein [Xanthobacteraceae bacterium]